MNCTTPTKRPHVSPFGPGNLLYNFSIIELPPPVATLILLRLRHGNAQFAGARCKGDALDVASRVVQLGTDAVELQPALRLDLLKSICWIPAWEKCKLIHNPLLKLLDLLAVVALLAAMALAGCGDDSPPINNDPPQPADGHQSRPIDQQTLEDITAELEGRSFRQFHPSVDASPRRGVILDFHDGFRMWGQYAEDGHAAYEWEIIADSYRIESAGEPSEFVLFPEGMTSEQQFPDPCLNCVQTAGVSISVRDVFDAGEIAFRINDPDSVLPPPFPVFHTWTAFNEDQVFH